MDTTRQWGENTACADLAKTEGRNLKVHSYLERRHYCTTCKHTFSFDKGTFFETLRTERQPLVEAVAMLVERNSLRADAVLAAPPLQDWQTIAWSEGAKGWWRAKCLALRCWRVDGEGTRHVGWLIGQRPGRGQSGDWTYFWSDFPATTPLAVLVEYAHRRHWVEQYHEEAKTELGWDQYQGRRWDGFHRHAMTVMLSYSFLVWLEGREREQRPLSGRPRAAFSPSPGPPPGASTTGPSPRERMAALCRHPRIDGIGSH